MGFHTFSLHRLALGALLLLSTLCFSPSIRAQSPLVVEDLECRGNVSTSCEFIRTHFYIEPGDIVDEDEIQNAKLRLHSSLLFSSIDVYLEKGSERGRARVIIEVLESNPIVKQAVLGTSYRLDALSEVVVGRLSHQNLFGAGKILDLEVGGRIPIGSPKRENLFSRLQYVDPHLLGSKRYFMIAGASYNQYYIENRHDDRYEQRFTTVDLALGRRLFDFSYVLVEYAYRFDRWFRFRERLRDGSIAEGSNRIDYDAWILGYGWNSEDDPWFPTSGSRFAWNISYVPRIDDEFHAFAFRKTWHTDGGSIWSVRIGGAPGTRFRSSQDESFGFTASYARSLNLTGNSVSRGRWYIEPGANDAPGYPEWTDVIEVGVKAGVRLDLASFGIVDLYVIGSTDIDTGAKR